MSPPGPDGAVLDSPSGLVTALLHELEQLPPARAAALRVVQVVDAPKSGSADVARAAAFTSLEIKSAQRVP